ncbi:hypothetical protein E2C01_046289 [Portunus trituberculatus]|uniref:Uncharacterized protein n=1 Tax=Portunus trituberculatus TaxID=210409 RepID=A0A5B7FXG8_PORTR|nr:hypothetical protein [Portunus trituberculatus]
MEGSGGTEGAACEVIHDIPPRRDCQRYTREVFALLYPDEALAKGKGGRCQRLVPIYTCRPC